MLEFLAAVKVISSSYPSQRICRDREIESRGGAAPLARPTFRVCQGSSDQNKPGLSTLQHRQNRIILDEKRLLTIDNSSKSLRCCDDTTSTALRFKKPHARREIELILPLFTFSQDGDGTLNYETSGRVSSMGGGGEVICDADCGCGS